MESVFKGKTTKAEEKEQKRREKQDELGVCRIRRSDGDTLGSGFVVKDLQSGPFSCPYCLISSDKVFPKDDFHKERYYLDFRKLGSTKLKTIKLEDVADKSAEMLRTSGLVVIPIKPSKKCGKNESIFTYRPFKVASEGFKPDENLRCHYVDDLRAELFAVKWLKVKESDVRGQYELHEVHETPYKTYAEVTHKGDRKPYGAVILKHSNNEFMVAGALTFTDDKRKNTSPVFFPLPLEKFAGQQSAPDDNEYPPPEQPRSADEGASVEAPGKATTIVETSAGQQPAPDDNKYPLPEQQPAAVEAASAEVEGSEETTDTTAALKIKVDVDSMKHAEHNTKNRTPVSATESGGSPELRRQERSVAPVSSGHVHPSYTGEAEVLQVPSRILTEEELFRLIASNYLLTTPPRCKDDHDEFLAYLKEMRVVLTGVDVGSLVITVKCDSLQILEELWGDYSSGRLGEVVQRCFVTKEILTEFSLAELKLKTTILEEEYTAYKMYFEKGSAVGGQCESDVGEEEIPAHFSGEKILTGTDDQEDFQTETVYGKLKTGTDKDDFGLDDEGISFSPSYWSSKLPQMLHLETWRHGMPQIARLGLESFDVSSPEGLQDYVAFLTDKMYSTGHPRTSGSDPIKERFSWKRYGSKQAGDTSTNPYTKEDKTAQQGGTTVYSMASKLKEDIKGARSVSPQKTSKPGQEFPSMKKLTEAMDDDELKQFVSIHVKEGTWQVVALVLKQLLDDQRLPSSIIWKSNKDAESNVDEIGTLFWWPVEEDRNLVTLFKVLTESDCKLNKLALSRNDEITDEGVKHLAEALAHDNCKLNSLNLSWNSQITDEGVKHLAQALTHNNCKLNSLDLSWNDKITDEGVKHLAEALMHKNCKLNSLNLIGNSKITDEGVKHLAEALTHNNCKLKSLDLRSNKSITDEGVKHLAEALTHSNCKLNSLNLRWNDKITDEGVKHLAEALMHHNCKLNSLSLRWNSKITNKGVEYLAEAVNRSNYELSGGVSRRDIQVTAKQKGRVSEKGPS